MAAAVTPTTLVDRTSLNRSSFPKGFIFGTASSSYQVSLLHSVCYCAFGDRFFATHLKYALGKTSLINQNFRTKMNL
jgi:hypothetical protein